MNPAHGKSWIMRKYIGLSAVLPEIQVVVDDESLQILIICRTYDLDILLTMLHDFTGREVESRILLVVPSASQELTLCHSIADPADIRPIDSARAHAAWFEVGI